MFIEHIRGRLFVVFNSDYEIEFEGTLNECRCFLIGFII